MYIYVVKRRFLMTPQVLFIYLEPYCIISEQQEEDMLRGTAASVRTRKTRTLQDLFRPPIDLTYKGTFANVRYFIFLLSL